MPRKKAATTKLKTSKKKTSAKAAKTTKKTTKKAAAPAKKIKKPAKKAAPKAAKKAPAKPVKAKAAKKAAPKPAPKKAAPKPAAKKAVKKAAPKKAAAKKAAAPKATAKKTATKKAAPAKKAAAKKRATKKKVVEKAPPRPKPTNVGQAPRKATLAASIPTPTTTPIKEAPQADKDASHNAAASKNAKQDFRANDKIVYPAHGVGRIAGLERQEIAGITIELFIIDFEQEKMKLRVPTGKAKTAGMRPLSTDTKIKEAIIVLKGRARIKRTMWSRRAQEYDAKINSGDIILVAEVVRDLFRAADQPEQSYSERQLFEAALDRMAREVAAVKKVDLGDALAEIDATLQKKSAAAAAAAAATAAAAAAAAAATAE